MSHGKAITKSAEWPCGHKPHDITSTAIRFEPNTLQFPFHNFLFGFVFHHWNLTMSCSNYSTLNGQLQMDIATLGPKIDLEHNGNKCDAQEVLNSTNIQRSHWHCNKLKCSFKLWHMITIITTFFHICRGKFVSLLHHLLQYSQCTSRQHFAALGSTFDSGALQCRAIGSWQLHHH
jgi:hypothetical protein